MINKFHGLGGHYIDTAQWCYKHVSSSEAGAVAGAGSGNDCSGAGAGAECQTVVSRSQVTTSAVRSSSTQSTVSAVCQETPSGNCTEPPPGPNMALWSPRMSGQEDCWDTETRAGLSLAQSPPTEPLL